MNAPFVKRVAPLATIAIVIGVVAVRRAATAESPRLAAATYGVDAQNGPAQSVQAQNDNRDRLTLHWVAGQAFGLAKDGTADLVWDGGVMRPRRGSRRDIDQEADEVETVWANGLVANLAKHDF